MTKRAKKEATPMADYINSRMAMIQMRKTTKRSALAHYKEGFVPTDHKHILTDTEITEYARRLRERLDGFEIDDEWAEVVEAEAEIERDEDDLLQTIYDYD